MDKVAVVAAVRACFVARRRREVERMRWRRQRMRRHQAFVKRQARQRLVFMMMLAGLSFGLHGQGSTVRSVWSKERSSHWWEHIVTSHFTPQDWLQNFRMSKDTFAYLCDQLHSSISKSDTIMRKAISTEQRVAITLWFLSTGSDYRTIGHLFGVSKSTVCVVTKEVCAAIVECLLPQYIKIPTGAALQENVEAFKTELGFPQCVGAVDGTHIPIISPQECPADYYNRKGWHSIILQGTVDHAGRFIDAYVGWPGRVHDARVFSNSSLYHRGQSNTLFPDLKESISGRDIPLVLLGDPAYPLLQWLMKAFPDNGRLSCEQKVFNYRLSKARVVVEHSYGRLKGRWRCLLKRLDVDVRDASELVAACCVLHNICEVHGDTFDDDWLNGVDNQEFESSSSCSNAGHHIQSATDTRNAFMAHFSQ